MIFNIADGRTHLYQYDTEVLLNIDLEEGDSVDAVHFVQGGGNSALVTEPTLEGTSLTVRVPNESLTKKENLIIYAWVKNDYHSDTRADEGGHTLVKETIKVIPRAKPVNYVISEDGSMSWEEWCKKAEGYAEECRIIKEDIETNVVPSVMAEWFEEHKDELKGEKGDRGDDGKDADPYDDTEIRAEITDVKNDLSQKVGFEDYATAEKGGVVKTYSGFGSAISSGALCGVNRTNEQYSSGDNRLLISKGTLENVVDPSHVVHDTDYATPNNGGVIKSGAYYDTQIQSGVLIGVVRTADEFNGTADSNYAFVSKGTLKNVLAGRAEEWTFTLEDGSIITKKVVCGID